MSVTIYQNSLSGTFSLNKDLWDPKNVLVFRIIYTPEELKEFVDSGNELLIDRKRYTTKRPTWNKSKQAFTYSKAISIRDFNRFVVN